MSKARNVLKRVRQKLLRKSYIDTLKEQGLRVGKNFKILADSRIDWSHCWHVEIGDDVTIGPRVLILAHDTSTKTALNYSRIGKVTIGDRVFIGAASVVLPGISIGNDVIIGAGSIVSRDIPGGSVAAGNPCRVLCSMEDFLARKQAELEQYPRFDEGYTLNRITDKMKDEMNTKMKHRFGYLI